MTGVVMKVMLGKGFGFVRGLDLQSRFFHAKDVIPASAFDTMHEGQKVTFIPAEGDKGNKLRAKEVRPC